VLAEAIIDTAAHKSSSNKSCPLHIFSLPGPELQERALILLRSDFGCVLLPKPLDLAKKGCAATRGEVSEMGGGRS